ncbi:MAG: PSD1 and planctomycete cytochrome C domain-containing protein [Verrucomicrobiae bacterium]|nr:PSD1 and planctomycete cytochrome C domain-containing protein [Verrucomicrobiae bacterium]
MKRFLPLLLSVVFLSANSGRALAADLTPSQLEFFESKIRPILVDNCYKCHSVDAEKIKGGLLLDSRDGVLKGGDSGKVIVPGDPEASLLIKAVRYGDPDLQMPKNKKLPDDQIAALEQWVKMGAPDPRVATASSKTWTDNKTNHWAWQPIKRVPVPEVDDNGWSKTPVDKFIFAKLAEKGLQPNPPADKRTLIRRATFDLIGLPPTPEEVQAFLDDSSPDAFAKVVDRLLASPHYGERWGRHWLDVARYSDTKGQPRRNDEDNVNPFAWTYRDYVIRSFNEDKPYNRFVLEQIAADRLSTSRQNPTNLAALGFLTVGDHFMGMQNDIINDRIDVVAKGFLALTVTCARCHDHKFDPIPQKDYYSFHGIFASCVEPKLEPVVSPIKVTPAFETYHEQRDKLAFEQSNLETSLPKLRKNKDQEAFKEARRTLQRVVHDIAMLDLTNTAAPMHAMVLEDTVRGHDSPVFLRGDPGNRGELVPRRFLQMLSAPNRPIYTNGSGRLELAMAIASKNNPLTPRVMINRIWEHHFGEGFVPTPDDFGMMSEPPSHPELLDYLATQFMNNGWSVKKIHRLIMLSSVYQESATGNPRFAEIDPGNRLLWRANTRRLEFEPLRDSLLAIGGMLDTNLYGRPVQNRALDSNRRTIYNLVDRANIADVLVNFDFANPDMVTGARYQTTVPQQALYLMNNPLVINLAKKLVAMPDFLDRTDDESKLQFLYERIYQRLPEPVETQLGLEFVTSTQLLDDSTNALAAIPPPEQLNAKGKPVKHPVNNTPKKPVPLTAWQEYAQALLQANEASFVN